MKLPAMKWSGHLLTERDCREFCVHQKIKQRPQHIWWMTIFFFQPESQLAWCYTESNGGWGVLTEFTNLEAMTWADFSGTRASSAPAITKTGKSLIACSNVAAFCGERTVSDESFPISWRASSQPSTHKGAWFHIGAANKWNGQCISCSCHSTSHLNQQ